MGKHFVFIFHGSKSLEVQSAIDKFNAQLIKRLKCPFSLCFLKGAVPNLNEALEKAVLNGATDIVCFPLFILPGQHICEDIPSIIKDFKSRYPDCNIEQKPSLIENNLFINFIIEAIGDKIV